MDWTLILLVVTGLSMIGVIALIALAGRQFELGVERLAALTEAEEDRRQAEYEEATLRLNELHEVIAGLEQTHNAMTSDLRGIGQELDAGRQELEAVTEKLANAQVCLTERTQAVALTNEQVTSAQKLHDSITGNVKELNGRLRREGA